MTYDAADAMTATRVGRSHRSDDNMDYGYDGLGRRVRRTVNGGRTDFWYDRTGMTLETTSGASSSSTTESAAARETQAALVDTAYQRDPSGNPLSISRDGSLHNYATDGAGTVTALTDTSGAETDSYRYEPFGEQTGSTGSTANSLRWGGNQFDDTSGLYWRSDGYYNTATGRTTGGTSAHAVHTPRYAGSDTANEPDSDCGSQSEPLSSTTGSDIGSNFTGVQSLGLLDFGSDFYDCFTDCITDFAVPAFLISAFSSACSILCVVTGGTACIACFSAVVAGYAAIVDYCGVKCLA